MKHLKKLSVALLATTLFSVSFTSCIDNEVSPIVEAIYSAQADLIAAQAKVQDAESALLTAQAAVQTAQAEVLKANAANSIKTTDAEVIKILAEAGFTDAEATQVLSNAQGDLAKALAAAGKTEAETAQILAEIARYELETAQEAATAEQDLILKVQTTKTAVALSQVELEIAQLNWEKLMAETIADMVEAGAIDAVAYAQKYRDYMNHANDLLELKVTAQGELAEADLMATSAYSTYNMDQLGFAVDNAQYLVEVQLAAITVLQEIIANPNSLSAKISAWEARIDEILIEKRLKKAEIDLIKEAAQNLLNGNNGQDQVIEDFVADYMQHISDKAGFDATILAAQNIINAKTALLNTWDADLTATTLAVTNATNAVNTAKTALGGVNGGALGNNSHTFASGTYLTKDKAGAALAGNGTKYTGTSKQEVLANAKIDKMKADADLASYAAGLSALTASYNLAAVNLNAAQNAFDTGNFAANLTTAEGLELIASTNAANAKTTYLAARALFEGNPTGSTIQDGLGLHSAGITEYTAPNQQFDRGEQGVIGSKTYMRVNAWSGSLSSFRPGGFAAGQILAADLATAAAAWQAANFNTPTAGMGSIIPNSQVLIWEDTAAGMTLVDINGNPVDIDGVGVWTGADTHFMNAMIQSNSANSQGSNTYAVYVEVGNDDTGLTYLKQFNVATNMYGKDDFSTRAIVGNPGGAGYNAPLTTTISGSNPISAVYSNPSDAEGEIIMNPATYALTAQAELWNAKLEVAYRTYLRDNSAALLQTAKDNFAIQKEMFDLGQITLATKTQTAADAATAQTTAQTAVDNALVVLGLTTALTPAITGNNATNAGYSPKWYKTGSVPSGSVAETNAGYVSSNFTVHASNNNTFTLAAVLYNAEIAKSVVLACNKACLQGLIDAAKHTIDLNKPQSDALGVIIAQMKPQYDMYYPTFINGGLDADIAAEYINKMHEAYELEAELAEIKAEEDFISDVISNVGYKGLDDISGDLQTLLTDTSNGSYKDALADLKTAEEALATAKAASSVAQSAAYRAYLEAKISTLESRYQNTLALANKYKALMDAALAL